MLAVRQKIKRQIKYIVYHVLDLNYNLHCRTLHAKQLGRLHSRNICSDSLRQCSAPGRTGWNRLASPPAAAGGRCLAQPMSEGTEAAPPSSRHSIVYYNTSSNSHGAQPRGVSFRSPILFRFQRLRNNEFKLF